MKCHNFSQNNTRTCFLGFSCSIGFTFLCITRVTTYCHHGNQKIFMKEQERKMVIFTSFFCPQAAAHNINDIYFDDNTLRWYSSIHKKIRAKILNGFWEKLDKVQPTFWNLNFSLVDFGVFQPQNSIWLMTICTHNHLKCA